MILYHGSNTDIDQIDLKAGISYKDFGQGFYLTPDIATAKRMAQKKANLFGGTPTLITYELKDDVFSNTSLKIKRFPEKATAEWFLFIDANRDRNLPHPTHEYDIVIGPIADDGVVLQLTSFHRGTSTAEQAALDLQDRYLDQQYFFGSEASLQMIRKVNTEKI
ncbi:MAG: DUF3990 domain-containing protein [Bacteroidales bacterium]|nr:DUF3990 domain-containing protein [Bacteroidales bacterium]